ncbi:UNVERIFIED_CONTAM: hypothetical protein RF648_08415 [Kocuria sp. CPCC 205274]
MEMTESRLRRTVQATASRFAMSGKPRIFAIVEGVIGDRPFYDHLLQNLPLKSEYSYSIRAAQDLKGLRSGGKSLVFAAWEEFTELGYLSVDGLGEAEVLFFMDRDFRLPGEPEDDKRRIVYTYGCDVESEIFANSDLVRAVSAAFHVSKQDVQDLGINRTEIYRDICTSARGLISLACASQRCGQTFGLRYADIRVRHSDDAVSVDTEHIAKSVSAVNGTDAEVLLKSASEIDWNSLERASSEWRLVKGKWVARFIYEYSKILRPKMSLASNIPQGALLAAAISCMELRPDTIRYYANRVGSYGILR